MKNVPHGTIHPKVAPLLFRAPMRAANRAGDKDQTRRIVAPSNSVLSYGDFEGLDLESARAVREDTDGELRAALAVPCTYARQQFRAGVTDTTQRRVVDVRPKVQVGDLFWEKIGRFGSRQKSEATYEVLRLDVRRVQDMTDAEASREGVAHVHVPTRFPLHARTPRGIFAWLWDQINGPGSWAKNPWVWVYHYRVIPQNIDAVLAARMAAPAGEEGGVRDPA